MGNLSRTARAETLLSKRARADIARAMARRDDFESQGLTGMAQGALEVRISVVVKMSVAGFLEYAATEAHGRYMAHLEVCGCRAVEITCKTGNALLAEWCEARELTGVDA